MQLCPRCNTLVPDDQWKCPVDGTVVDPLIGATIGGAYRCEERIGQGGMGRVYRARHLAMGRDVAIKLVLAGKGQSDQMLARFEREAKAAGRLSHPNTVTVYDFGTTKEGLIFLVMEYLKGETLSARVTRSHPLPLNIIAHILTQIAASLGEAHRAGIVHRDLKPANIILIERNGRKDFVKVVDFGLAKAFLPEADEGLDSVTRDRMVIGTPTYMSPEQVRCEYLDHRSDIYGLGVLAYLLVTGRPPFVADEYQLLVMHLKETPRPPSHLRPELPKESEDAILKTLAKAADDRYSSAEEFALAFSAAIGPPPATGEHYSVTPTPYHVGTMTPTSRPRSLTADAMNELSTPTALSGEMLSLKKSVSMVREPNTSSSWPLMITLGLVFVALITFSTIAFISLKSGDAEREIGVVSLASDQSPHPTDKDKQSGLPLVLVTGQEPEKVSEVAPNDTEPEQQAQVLPSPNEADEAEESQAAALAKAPKAERPKASTRTTPAPKRKRPARRPATATPAIEAQPPPQANHLETGRQQMMAGNLAEAAREFNLAVQQQPNSANAHHELGTALYRMGNGQRALHHFQRFLHLAPSDPRARKIENLILKIKGF